MDHCAWWKGLRRHLDEMRGCRVGTNYRIWLGKQCYKLNCHSSKKVANFFRSGQVTALKIILSGEKYFQGLMKKVLSIKSEKREIEKGVYH